MKILLTSVGTRGDMEPFLAAAELLRNAGHKTACAFPEQYRDLARSGGHGFHSLGTEFIEMLESETGKRALGGAGTTWQKLKAYRQLQKEYAQINSRMMRLQYQSVQESCPDRIVHNAKAIYPVIWGLEHPGQSVLISPVPYVLHPVRNYSHIGFNRNLGPWLNKLTYKLGHWGLTHTILKNAKALPANPGLDKEAINRALFASRAIYSISPSLFPQPPEWPGHVRVLGYHERDKTSDWKPEATLLQFLERNPRLLMVTFGSMMNPDPLGKTRVVLNALQDLGIPALINSAGGGLTEPDTYDTEQFYFTANIPYDWILPHIHALVHHGGSGTTHMAVKYGCASMIVPHIIDQFLWNRLLEKNGVGPRGPSITKLSEANLTPLLRDLWENPEYKKKSEALSAQMAREDFAEEVVRTIIQ